MDLVRFVTCACPVGWVVFLMMQGRSSSRIWVCQPGSNPHATIGICYSLALRFVHLGSSCQLHFLWLGYCKCTGVVLRVSGLPNPIQPQSSSEDFTVHRSSFVSTGAVLRGFWAARLTFFCAQAGRFVGLVPIDTRLHKNIINVA